MNKSNLVDGVNCKNWFSNVKPCLFFCECVLLHKHCHKITCNLQFSFNFLLSIICQFYYSLFPPWLLFPWMTIFFCLILFIQRKLANKTYHQEETPWLNKDSAHLERSSTSSPPMDFLLQLEYLAQHEHGQPVQRKIKLKKHEHINFLPSVSTSLPTNVINLSENMGALGSKMQKKRTTSKTYVTLLEKLWKPRERENLHIEILSLS